MVIEDPLDFNILLGRDYVYAMQAVVSTFFHVMYFNHGKEIVTIDQLDFLDPSPDLTRDQVFPLLVPSVSIDTTPPRVNYVASCPLCSIAIEKQPLFSCLSSRDMVPIVDQVSHPIQTMDPDLHSVEPFEILDMCPILDDLLPSDEVFLESLIQSDLLLDVGSVVTKSNPDFPSKPELSSYVGLIESLDSFFEQQVSDPDEFDFSYEFFNSCDTDFFPADSIFLVDFCSPSEVDLTDYKTLRLGAIESSSVDSTLKILSVEDSKVARVSAKVQPVSDLFF